LKAQRFELPDQTHTVIEWFERDALPAQGLVAFLPALGASVSYYRPLAEAWAALGYRVATIELRGGKQSSVQDVRRQNFGYHELLSVDLANIVPALRAAANGCPLLLAGHSLGGQLALLYASLHPAEVDAVVLLAGGSNYYATVPSAQRLRRQLALRLARAITQVLRYFPGHRLGFGGKQPQNLILDWTTEALTGKYSVKGEAVDYERELEQLGLPVLFVSLRGDRLVPKTCADYLAQKLTRARVTQIELSTPNGEAYNHFRWVKEPTPVLAEVDQWLRSLRSSAPSSRVATEGAHA